MKTPVAGSMVGAGGGGVEAEVERLGRGFRIGGRGRDDGRVAGVDGAVGDGGQGGGDELTRRVAGSLVALPAGLETVTVKAAPESAAWTLLRV